MNCTEVSQRCVFELTFYVEFAGALDLPRYAQLPYLALPALFFLVSVNPELGKRRFENG
jgi:hypothetical protein